jgi:Fe-S cluster assembly protein SufD
VTHYKVQREAASGFHVSTLQVHQHASSRFTSHSVSLGAALSRHDINIDLAGPGAECSLDGLYMASGRQHVDYHTLIEHKVPHCTSREDYKGVLGGRGRGVFNGRVIVHEGAQKTDASQSNKNLLLSADAEIDTKPQLEIYADDVKCAHGATVGQLDERMVFYLRSRGLDHAQARALLTYGFACDVVDRMGIEPLHRIVADALLDELPHADELRSMLR